MYLKVSQSNSRFNTLDIPVVTVPSVKMPVGFAYGFKTNGRPLSVMANLKSHMVQVTAEENCLAHALIIAIAKLENDTNYTAYRKGRKIRPVVQTLFQETGIDLANGVGIAELNRFEEHSREIRFLFIKV